VGCCLILKFHPDNYANIPKMKIRLLLTFFFLGNFTFTEASKGPIRVLFLGHESKHHNSNEYYPMLSKALGRDAIYFDYVTSMEEALGDAEYLGKFDALLLYANHPRL
ncbi:uncharacterized protein METZ01_LOCUS155890, partial [marine metagenome]